MIIQESDFRLESVDDSDYRFNLELLYTVNKGKKDKERQEFKNCGYSLSLDSAINKIVQYRISCKHGEEAITLKTYFKEFKEELNNIKELIYGN